MAIRNCADIGENLQKILKYLIADAELGKLLFYTDKDPLKPEHMAPTANQLYEKLIRITPKVTEDDNAKSIVVLRVDSGSTLPNNGEFKTVKLSVEVFVPLTQWFIKDTNLRPFAILGRIQKLLNGLKINGMGQLGGGDFELKFITDEISCYVAYYEFISYD